IGFDADVRAVAAEVLGAGPRVVVADVARLADVEQVGRDIEADPELLALDRAAAAPAAALGLVAELLALAVLDAREARVALVVAVAAAARGLLVAALVAGEAGLTVALLHALVGLLAAGERGRLGPLVELVGDVDDARLLVRAVVIDLVLLGVVGARVD